MNIDLDNIQWWGDIAHKFITSFGVIGLAIYHWIEWAQKAEEKVNWFQHHIERRSENMNIIQEVEALIKVVPQVEKVIADAKAAEQTPQVAQLITDLETIIAEVRAVIPSSPAPAAPVPLPPAA